MNKIHNCQVCKRLGREKCPYPSNQDYMLYSFRTSNNPKKSQSLRKLSKTKVIEKTFEIDKPTYTRHSQSNNGLTMKYTSNQDNRQGYNNVRSESQQYRNSHTLSNYSKMRQSITNYRVNPDYFNHESNHQSSYNSHGYENNYNQIAMSETIYQNQYSTMQYPSTNYMISNASQLVYYPIYPVYEVSQDMSWEGEEEKNRSNRNSFSDYSNNNYQNGIGRMIL